MAQIKTTENQNQFITVYLQKLATVNKLQNPDVKRSANTDELPKPNYYAEVLNTTKQCISRQCRMYKTKNTNI